MDNLKDVKEWMRRANGNLARSHVLVLNSNSASQFRIYGYLIRSLYPNCYFTLLVLKNIHVISSPDPIIKLWKEIILWNKMLLSRYHVHG